MSQSDAVSLRMLLGRIDSSAPAIQAAAAAMMKHYDKSAGVAVVEWRNCLHNCRRDQLMPLLYVANEVLQNSKRNRGNKFLEAFSPVLGQSIVYMVQQDASIVEKIRRTVKIWGDRRVLSVRFVNELLHGLDPFREGGRKNSQTASTPSSRIPTRRPSAPAVAVVAAESEGFSPPIESQDSSRPTSTDPSADNMIQDVDEVDENDVFINENDEEEEDDFDFFLRDSSEGSGGGLDVQLHVDPAMLLSSTQPQGATTASTAAASSVNQRWLKRRRSSMESAGSGASSQSVAKRGSQLRQPTTIAPSGGNQRRTKSRRRRSLNLLSTNSLLELWNQVSSLQQSFDYSLAMLSDITPESLSDNSQDLETMVGDSLLDQYRQVLRFQELVSQQRRSLHGIAQERYQLQKEAVRYLPWLELALKQDLEDIAFCNDLEQKLELVRDLHGPARQARDERLAEEELKRAQEEELERQRKEEAERLKFLESALNKETEAKPGMVWNRATGEYQYLNTEESWRD